MAMNLSSSKTTSTETHPTTTAPTFVLCAQTAIDSFRLSRVAIVAEADSIENIACSKANHSKKIKGVTDHPPNDWSHATLRRFSTESPVWSEQRDSNPQCLATIAWKAIALPLGYVRSSNLAVTKPVL